MHIESIPPAQHGGRCSLRHGDHDWLLSWIDLDAATGAKRQTLHSCRRCGAHYFQRSLPLHVSVDGSCGSAYWNAPGAHVTWETDRASMRPAAENIQMD